MKSIPCSGCGRLLQIEESRQGGNVRCSNCQTIVQVPADANDRSVPVQESAEPSFDTPPRPNASLPSALHEQTVHLENKEYPIIERPSIPGFSIGKELGRGGMGVVYQAREDKLDRLVALKVLNRTTNSDQTARERFLREAKAMAALDHDHVISVFQVGEYEGMPYLAMPLLHGESLASRLRRDGKLPPAEVLRIGREMADGMSAAHSQGLVHRDIKPANIWLEGERCRVKILDFGLARAEQDKVELTQSNAILGTPAYLSPEQAQGKKAEARSDLFSLGCILYQMCSGRRPRRWRCAASANGTSPDNQYSQVA